MLPGSQPGFLLPVSRSDLTVSFHLPHDDLKDIIAGYNIYGAFGPKLGFTEFYFPPWPTIRFSYSVDAWRVQYRGVATPQPVPPAALFGPSRTDLRASVIPEGISLGWAINPVGVRRLLGVRADQISGRLLALDALWPDASAIHREIGRIGDEGELVAYLDQLLLSRLRPPIARHREVAALSALLVSDHDIDVQAVAGQLGLSVATLRRVALEHFGFPVKLLLRRSRFMKSLAAIHGRDRGEWSRLIDPSYHDQSHFIRDCRAFLGCGPGEFLARDRPMTRLSVAARQKALGAPFAALHASRPGSKDARQSG